MQTKPPDAGKKHRAVFDVKKIACVSHSFMFHRLRRRRRQAQTAKDMASEIASGEQECDDSQKEKMSGTRYTSVFLMEFQFTAFGVIAL